MNSYKALEDAFHYLIHRNIPIPDDLLHDLRVAGIKSQDYYEANLKRLVRSLYKGDIDELEFTFVFGDLITGQLTKAWNEGMLENGVLEDDMTDEWRIMLGDIITQEKGQVGEYANAIISASMLTNEPIDPLLARASLWANRYQDVYNQAVIATADEKTKLEWVMGATEEHCSTCYALNGLVAYAREWEEMAVKPQQPPNTMLECGGWRCQCSLQPTTNRHTRNVKTKIAEALVGGG